MLGVGTDCGSDINFALVNIHDVGFEWGVQHPLNDAIADAFDLSIARGSSKHPTSRVVITSMEKGVEHIKNSDQGKIRRAAMLGVGSDLQAKVNAFDRDMCYRYQSLEAIVCVEYYFPEHNR